MKSIRFPSSPTYRGGIKEVVALFIPLLVMTFSTSVVGFTDRLFFGKLSVAAIEAAVSVAYVSRVFQIPCVGLAIMVQVYVGRLQGAHEESSIGRYVWQFIWFSLLSVFITIPFSLIYGTLYFQSTAIEDSVFFYFVFMMSLNFLYPLGTCLSGFYVGRGRPGFILLITLIADVFNILLAYVFIFGVADWFPSLGLVGGALATLIAQTLFCVFLLSNFLSKKHAVVYGTHDWRFKPKLFLECIYPGFFRALQGMSIYICWSLIGYVMISRGGDYLLIWSLGSAIGLFLPFIGTAMYQALTTIASNILGASQEKFLGRLAYSGFWVISLIIMLMAIPLLLFPVETCHLLFPRIDINPTAVTHAFLGLWLSFSFGTLACIPLSYLLAVKDTRFLLCLSSFCWVNGFVVMYLAVNVFDVSAAQCWIILSWTNLFDLLLYSWRAGWLIYQKSEQATAVG